MSANLINVVELFGPTIQGEGIVIGHQTNFIRFGGCDFKCAKCDSLHAVYAEFFPSTTVQKTPEELPVYVNEWLADKKLEHIPWMTLTGGNPALFDLAPLIEGVPAKMSLETQGSIWQDWIPSCDVITVSPKGPGMGEKFNPEQFDVFVQRLQHHPKFVCKVVVFDQRDLEFALSLMDHWPMLEDRFYLSIGNDLPPPVKGAPAYKADPGQQKDERLHAHFNREAPDSLSDHRNQLLNKMDSLLNAIMFDSRLRNAIVLPQLHALIWSNQQEK